MEFDKLCMGCMKEKASTGVCEFCGYDEANAEQDQRCLSPRTILNGQYLVGKVLGQGGFGITYLAYDLNLSFKVAIKEYLPDGLATRNMGTTTVSVFTNEKKHNFDYGLEKFLEEAKMMAKFNNVPSIVSVRNFFRENGTAYFVMDFIEGKSLSEHLKQNGNKLSLEEAQKIVLKVADALEIVHNEGMIHRDIAPDNVYMTKDGNIKLMDFGAARFAMGEHNKTLSIILKPGYAPEEQYRTKGQQGPWTDIYALGAMFYRMITGETPPQSVDRLYQDELLAPSKLLGGMPANIEQAIIHSLAVNSENRIKSISDFKKALEGSLQLEQPNAAPQQIHPKPAFQQQQPQPQPVYQQGNQLNSIYEERFQLHTLPESQTDGYKGNGFKYPYPTILAVLLHIFTLGISSMFCVAMKHSRLPKIKSDDFGAGKAIGLLFVPFYNFYWIFIVWLRLVDRINLQFRLRGQNSPVSRSLVQLMLIFNFIPLLNVISFLIIEPICLSSIQSACNTLAAEKTNKPATPPVVASIVIIAVCAVVIPFSYYQMFKYINDNKYDPWDDTGAYVDSTTEEQYTSDYEDSTSYDDTTSYEEETTIPPAPNQDITTEDSGDSPLLLKTIESSDKNFMFSVPQDWSTVTGVNSDAQIQMVDANKEKYMISISEEKSSFGSSVTFDDYCKLIEDNIKSAAPDVVFSDREDITVNGNRAIRFTAEGTVNSIKITYIITLIDSPNYYSQILGWCLTNSFEQNKDLLTEIEDTYVVD